MSEANLRKRTATAWGFLTPALVLIGLSVLIPAAMALVMSFSQAGLDVSEPLRFVGLANIRRLLADPMFFRVTGTTFLYLLGVVPPLPLARGKAQEERYPEHPRSRYHGLTRS